MKNPYKWKRRWESAGLKICTFTELDSGMFTMDIQYYRYANPGYLLITKYMDGRVLRDDPS